MAANINPQIIKRTQETLGKYVKKPVLSEKLLKKPPFRFLYDVVCAVSIQKIPMKIVFNFIMSISLECEILLKYSTVGYLH